MSTPAYHLVPNKAVDRLALIDAIKLLGRHEELAAYTYFGFGGPYLEDFRLLYEHCPELAMVSIESDAQVVKRQHFHLPCSTVKVRHEGLRSFLNKYESEDRRSIFWLDYTNLDYRNFEDFMMLLTKVAERSMVKITLRADPRAYLSEDGPEKFRDEFGKVMPGSSDVLPRRAADFAQLLQDMLQIAAQQALPAAIPYVFQPVSSFFYQDTTPMFTLTGMVWNRVDLGALKGIYESWPFANLAWLGPRLIDIPTLSTKERLKIQEHLPGGPISGGSLRTVLGYRIDDTNAQTNRKLEQYVEYHRFAPYFVKAVP